MTQYEFSMLASILEEMLSESGYEVTAFPHGKLALSAAAQYPPDLILLDIMMPDLDGFEVCQRLKANSATSDIPVIFISALMTHTAKSMPLRVEEWIISPNPSRKQKFWRG